MEAGPSPLPCAAALLAGGESRRYGSDKSQAILPGDTQPLWQLQLNKLKQSSPAELLAGLRPGQALDLPPGVKTVFDTPPGLGPLGSLAPLLEAIRSPLLLVLAVDMPRIEPADLDHLTGLAQSARTGVVPRRKERWEPLFAVYPRDLLPLVRRQIAAGRRSLQDLNDRALGQGLIQAWEVPPEREEIFFNINRPEDVQALHKPITE